MNKRTIIILVLCAALIAVVAVISLRKDPGISGLYLSDAPTFNDTVDTDRKSRAEFQSEGTDIFLIISIRDLSTEDEIEVSWTISGSGGTTIFQENTVSPNNPGSGEIIIYLLKRDMAYPEGDYTVEAVLNNSQKIKVGFTVTAR
ncbi:MAG: hypothetical protein MUO59_07905 [Actinobacteria bacterium]|nr:hypothetical protein [Actinomycetota bacterium]